MLQVVCKCFNKLVMHQKREIGGREGERRRKRKGDKDEEEEREGELTKR